MKPRYKGCYRGPRFVKITLLNGRLILCKWTWKDVVWADAHQLKMFTDPPEQSCACID